MDLWDSPQALADDIGAKLSRIQKWRARKKIPPSAWPKVLDAAKRRGLPVDAEQLVRANVPPVRVCGESSVSP